MEKRLRPLLCVYLSEESPFYVERLWDFFQRHALPEKYEYMEAVKTSLQGIPTTVEVFRKKFDLVGSTFRTLSFSRCPCRSFGRSWKVKLGK